MPPSHVFVGSNVGAEGTPVGRGEVGTLLGSGVGVPVGSWEGTEVGTLVGSGEGTLLGRGESEGNGEGGAEGLSLCVGKDVGAHVWVEGSVSQHEVPRSLPVVICQPLVTPFERARISVGISSQNSLA